MRINAKNTKGKLEMELQQIIMLITIAVYLIMMVVVGVICAKKTDNVGDFYLEEESWDRLLPQ